MAIYIPLNKQSEDDAAAYYTYGVAVAGPDPTRPKRQAVHYELGVLRLDKVTGEVALVDRSSADSEGIFFARAAQKLTQHWKAGDFPTETCWAS